MPTKTTKKTSAKKWSSKLNIVSKKGETPSKSLDKSEKKDSVKKGIVKRRKLDLTPTRASAVAIASQANREKKKALIERLQSWQSEPSTVESKTKDDTKIPLWVWTFFGCSLLLFCISFYQAVFRPSIERNLMNPNIDWVNNSGSNVQDLDENEGLSDAGQGDSVDNEVNDNSVITPTTAIEITQTYFDLLSNRQFDETFDLFAPVLRNSSEMKNHFTSFRMNPFLDWIEWWKLEPTNFRYIWSPTFWRDRYGFDLSYVLKSNQEKYEEEWEVLVDTKWEELKIVSIACVTPKCSYHPIFRPENFGLLR